MKKKSRAFANQLVVCLLLAIGAGGTVGLGMVWMRHQISTTANGNRQAAARVAEIERLIGEKHAAIESAQRPDLLRERNVALRLGLVSMNDVPVVNVPEDVVRRMAVRANRELFAEAAPITLRIAQR